MLTVYLVCSGTAAEAERALLDLKLSSLQPKWHLILDGNDFSLRRYVRAQISPNQCTVLETHADLPGALNRLIELDSSKYIAIIDSHDISTRKYFETAINALESSPNAAVYAPCVASRNPNVLNIIPFTGDALYGAVHATFDFPYCSVFKESAWKAVGGLRPELSAAGGLWHFLQSLAARPGIVIHGTEPLVYMSAKSLSAWRKPDVLASGMATAIVNLLHSDIDRLRDLLTEMLAERRRLDHESASLTLAVRMHERFFGWKIHCFLMRWLPFIYRPLKFFLKRGAQLARSH